MCFTGRYASAFGKDFHNFHITEKALNLMKRVIRSSSPPNPSRCIPLRFNIHLKHLKLIRTTTIAGTALTLTTWMKDWWQLFKLTSKRNAIVKLGRVSTSVFVKSTLHFHFYFVVTTYIKL